jgi:hypothetical protein
MSTSALTAAYDHEEDRAAAQALPAECRAEAA